MKVNFTVIKQEGWNENLATAIANFCLIYEIRITKSAIFDQYVGKKGMVNFREVASFCKEYSFDHIQLNFVKEHMDKKFCPAFVLMEGYRTQLMFDIDDQWVYYIDSLTGKEREEKDKFFKRSMGYIIMIDPEKYSPEKDYEQKRHIEIENQQKNNRKWIKPVVTEISEIELAKRIADSTLK